MSEKPEEKKRERVIQIKATDTQPAFEALQAAASVARAYQSSKLFKII